MTHGFGRIVGNSELATHAILLRGYRQFLHTVFISLTRVARPSTPPNKLSHNSRPTPSSSTCTSTVPPTSCLRVPPLLSFTPQLRRVHRMNSQHLLRNDAGCFSSSSPSSVFRASLPHFLEKMCASRATRFHSANCALFISLAAFFGIASLCFQQIAHSSTKYGGGIPRCLSATWALGDANT
jgi:hypothetical protein